MIRLVTLDMAGTTVNDGGGVYRALQLCVEECGASVAAHDLQTWMGTEKHEAIEALMRLGGVDPEGRVEVAYERFQTILHEIYADEPPVAIVGVPAAISELRQSGIKVALTTGFSREVATTILSELGWSIAASSGDQQPGVIVDALVCGDEVSAGRPAPYLIHRAMERTGTLCVRDVLVAGDTIVDVQSGLNAGAAQSIGVLTGALNEDDFASITQAVVLNSVVEIPEYLQKLNAELS